MGSPDATRTPASKRQRRHRSPSPPGQQRPNDGQHYSHAEPADDPCPSQSHPQTHQRPEERQAVNGTSQNSGPLSNALEHEHEREDEIFPSMQNPLASGPCRFIIDSRGRRRKCRIETNLTWLFFFLLLMFANTVHRFPWPLVNMGV